MDDPARWRRIGPILEQAFELPESERAGFLERSGIDDELRHEIEELLSALGGQEDFLEVPAASWLVADWESVEPAGDEPPSGPEPGTRIGPYRVVRTIGRGGMGTVVLAQRADGGFEQSVALKLVDRALVSKDAIRHAFQERRILARLDHPNIARLLDAGVLADGTPWLAMEYIEGTSLDAYCAERVPDLAPRIELFLQVCDAVQYAHEHLVVHRDLKPANVLVTRDGRVKLLDFGVAKILDEADGTHTASRYVTPRYASPEQLTGQRISTATDVYGLGLVLYEILTGRRAHGDEGLGPLDLRRTIVETEPEPPSRAVTRPPAALGKAPAAPQLARRLAGDLDAIVAKALRKEPEHRYPTAAALAYDVRNYLDSRPVEAARGNTAYRLERFVRRHRVQVGAAALIVLSLAAGAIASAAQARIAAAERDRARAAEATGSAIHDFLVNDMLAAPRPETGGGRDLTVREVLDGAARSVEHAFAQAPEVAAAVRLTLARTYRSLGDYAPAREHAAEAAEALAGLRGESDRATLAARALVAEIRAAEGAYAEARSALEQVRAAQAAELGPDDLDTLATTVALGRVLTGADEPAAAEALLHSVPDEIRLRHPEAWRLHAEASTRLAEALVESRRLEQAEGLFHEALELRLARLGPDHPETLETERSLGWCLIRQLLLDDAEAVLRDVLERRKRVLGVDHPATGVSLKDLSIVLDRAYRYDESMALAREAYEVFQRTLGDDHPQTVSALRNLGVMARYAGRHAEAESIYRAVWASRRRTLGEDHPQTIRAGRDVQVALVLRNRLDEARAVARRIAESYERIAARSDAEPEVLREYAEFLLAVDPADARDPRRALAISERAVEESGRRSYHILAVLADAEYANGRLDRAVAIEREALALPEGVHSWYAEKQLVRFLVDSGRPDEAERFLRDNLERRLNVRGADDDLAGQTLQLLGERLADRGRTSEAEAAFRRALEQFRRSLSDTDWRIGVAKTSLAGTLLARGAYEEAEALALEGYRTLDADQRTGPESLQAARRRIAEVYEAWGKPDRAIPWRSQD